jgi:transposase InsO family protein
MNINNIFLNNCKNVLFCAFNPKAELMHHSDRGCQYTSEKFTELAKEKNIKLSMSAKGRCYDNPVVESFFHTLKTEHVDLCQFRTREEAINSIFEYVEVFYNRKRLHSTLGYLSPLEFEDKWMEKNQKKMCS